MSGSSSSKHFRTVKDLLKPIRKRPTNECSNSQWRSRKSPALRRNVSTATPHRSEMEVESDTSPRWSRTPEAMRGTVKPRFWVEKDVKLPEINKDPKKLNEFYVKFLGPDGDQLLSEETKWLAVTHKSFDHGRRGFNDRLAFLGRRIYELQTTLALMNKHEPSQNAAADLDPHGRKPFRHPATESLEPLAGKAREVFTHHCTIARVAEQYGITKVMRWLPRKPDSLVASGSDMVYTQAMLAIVGGLALERGSGVANRVAVERLLHPMGFNVQKIQQRS